MSNPAYHTLLAPFLHNKLPAWMNFKRHFSSKRPSPTRLQEQSHPQWSRFTIDTTNLSLTMSKQRPRTMVGWKKRETNNKLEKPTTMTSKLYIQCGSAVLLSVRKRHERGQLSRNKMKRVYCARHHNSSNITWTSGSPGEWIEGAAVPGRAIYSWCVVNIDVCN